MKNNVIFGMGIFHTANGLKVLRQAEINVRQMSRGDSFGCVIFNFLWDNGAKTQPRQNTGSEFNAYLKQIKEILSAMKKYRIFSLVTNMIYIFSL